LIGPSENGRQIPNPRTSITHNGDETLGNAPVGSGSTPSKGKFSRGFACIAKSVTGNFGDGCRNANLLLSIKAQGGGNGSCPVPAEHDILFSPEGHQQQQIDALYRLYPP
jgi:hypothetical protein